MPITLINTLQNKNEAPVICTETVDIKEALFVEKGHFYLMAYNGETFVLIDYFNRGFRSEISKHDLQYFKVVTQEQFDVYEECCNEGNTNRISEIVKEILS